MFSVGESIVAFEDLIFYFESTGVYLQVTPSFNKVLHITIQKKYMLKLTLTRNKKTKGGFTWALSVFLCFLCRRFYPFDS